MKMNRILFFGIIIVLMISNVSAKNTMLEDIQLSIGLIKNEYHTASTANTDINIDLFVTSAYDINNVEWRVDGMTVKNENKTRLSYFNPIGKLQKSKDKNKIVYKAGKDNATQKYIHKVTAKYDGKVTTWFLLE